MKNELAYIQEVRARKLNLSDMTVLLTIKAKGESRLNAISKACQFSKQATLVCIRKLVDHEYINCSCPPRSKWNNYSLNDRGTAFLNYLSYLE